MSKNFRRVGAEFQAEIPLLSEKPAVCWQEMDIINHLPKPKVCSWSDIEKSSFLLGLHIFGKDFSLVKKFVSSKSMGDVLHYYYGNDFYMSAGYRMWSEVRKSGVKGCLLGAEIFQGLRLRELLSRLSQHLSEEQCKMLTKKGSQLSGKVKMVDYIFMLRDLVGIGALVEAVDIGKEIRDHTAANTTVEPPVVPPKPSRMSGGAPKPFTVVDTSNLITTTNREGAKAEVKRTLHLDVAVASGISRRNHIENQCTENSPAKAEISSGHPQNNQSTTNIISDRQKTSWSRHLNSKRSSSVPSQEVSSSSAHSTALNLKRRNEEEEESNGRNRNGPSPENSYPQIVVELKIHDDGSADNTNKKQKVAVAGSVPEKTNPPRRRQSKPLYQLI